MCGKELNAVDGEGLGVHCIGLDDRHRMVVDTEHIVRVAGERNQAEPIPAGRVGTRTKPYSCTAYRLPLTTLITDSVAVGVEGLLPSPLITVASAPSLPIKRVRERGGYNAEKLHGKRGPSLAATWYQSARVITVLSNEQWYISGTGHFVPELRCSPSSISYKYLWGSSGSYTTNAPRRPSQYCVDR